jgi:gas vesicle protein
VAFKTFCLACRLSSTVAQVSSDINSIWEKTKTAIIETCKETIGYVQHNQKKWMSDETWARVEERRQAKQKVLNATTRSQKCLFFPSL